MRAESPPPYPERMNISRFVSVLALMALVAACSTADPGSPTTAFSGATVWDGSGATAVPNTTLFVREGRIVGMASDGSVPERRRCHRDGGPLGALRDPRAH